MKNVLMGMLILMVTGAVSQADIIRNVTASASSEYTTLGAPGTDYTVSWRGMEVDGRAGLAAGWIQTIEGDPDSYLREGIGFYEWKGYHINETYDRHYDNPEGTMWLTAPYTNPTGQWIEFDLTADPNATDLAAIKVWNFNQASPSSAWDKLEAGVQSMDIVLYDSTGINVISTVTPTTNIQLPMAPGLAEVDFGQVIDIANDYNGGTPVSGVRYVQFSINSNHGDWFGQVGLSEVKFYDSRNTVQAYPGLFKRAWLEDTGGLGDPDDYQAVVVFDDVDHKGGVGPFNYTWNWYSPMHAAALTDPNSPGPLPAPVFDPVNSLNPTVTFPNESRVTVPGWSSYPVAGNYVFALTIEDVGAGVTVTSPNKTVTIQNPDFTGLFAHWKFNEGTGTTSADEFGNLNITSGIAGALEPGWVSPGVDGTGYALDFLGKVNSGDAIALPESILGSVHNLTEVTCSLWFKYRPPTGANANNVAYNTMGLIDSGAFRAHIIGDRVLARVVVTRTGAEYANMPGGLGTFDQYDIAGKTKLNPDTWHHMVITYDRYTARLYIDGRLDAERITYPGQLTTGLIGALMMGARNNGGSKDLELDGVLDDVRLYNIALDQGDVAALYEEVKGQPPCTTPLDGDLNGDCVVDLKDFATLAQDWLL